MSVLEIISAILLILSCVFIIRVVLMQDSKQGMSQTISGSSGDNYYQKNSGRTKEAKLARMTKIAAIVVFVVALLVNLITIYGWGKKNSGSNNSSATTSAVTTTVNETGTGSEENTAATNADTAADTAEVSTAA